MNTIMLEFIPALRVEFQKMRRTKTLWLTIFGFILASVIGGLFMYILKDPERARQLGVIGAKAQVFGGSAESWITQQAQYDLAAALAEGKGVEKNETEAVEWLRKAAEQGQPRACYDLGHMIAQGRGVAKDEAKAV